MLNDQEANVLRGSVLDLADRFDTLNDLERLGFQSAQTELLEYERAVVADKRVPYQQAPKQTMENLAQYREILDGKTDLFTEDDDDEVRAQTVGTAYLASKFKTSEEDVITNWPAYSKALMDHTATDNFSAALRQDMDATTEKMTMVNDAYGDAFSQAANFDSVASGAFQSFVGALGGREVPEELGNFYNEAFSE